MSESRPSSCDRTAARAAGGPITLSGEKSNMPKNGQRKSLGTQHANSRTNLSQRLSACVLRHQRGNGDPFCKQMRAYNCNLRSSLDGIALLDLLLDNVGRAPALSRLVCLVLSRVPPWDRLSSAMLCIVDSWSLLQFRVVWLPRGGKGGEEERRTRVTRHATAANHECI